MQWCLYYPGVLDLRELGFATRRAGSIAPVVDAYRSGDLLRALSAWPTGYEPRTHSERLLRAATLLAVGEVERARAILAMVPATLPGRRALDRLIAAVQFKAEPLKGAPETAAEWLAESYARQSRGELEQALRAAHQAVVLSPEFGFAWAREAELEFSFGRTMRAMRSLERALVLSPRNAQAHALQGFLLAAQNRIGAARRSFDHAIQLDGALGNAWLGRGLTFIRQGDEERGRRDLQVAVSVEPNRSILRSYLGKGFSDAGDRMNAELELDRARELDRKDPTPWLYQALQDRQANRLNAAVRDLEQSLALNDDRRLFRSRFLLDQDKAVRGANLASIYQLNGMQEVAVREAARAVNADYASAGAHLFLANSYNSLRDPHRIVLRYETPFINEARLANLLAPVGAGPLSHFISEQEYSKLFEGDGLGLASLTEYRSDGQFRQIASLFGTFGNVDFSFDADYFRDDDDRPGRRGSRVADLGAKVKFQLTPSDVILIESSGQNLREGDPRQLYDERAVARSLHLEEKQEPGTLLVGLRHEWAPGIHTLMLGGRLASEQTLDLNRSVPIFLFVPFELFPGGQELRPGFALFDTLDRPFHEIYDLDLEIGTGEVQQIITLGPHTIVAGVRYQEGSFHIRTVLDDALAPRDARFDEPASRNDFDADFERLSTYLYETFRLSRTLTLIAGVTYDHLTSPDHFREPPLRDESRSIEHWSPKAGIIFEPYQWLRLRGAYAEAISGVSLDESNRLEPTQIAGFNQGFRTLINESVAGSVSAARYKIVGAALEAKLPTDTYVGLEWSEAKQEGNRRIGVFDDFLTEPLPSARVGPGLVEQLDYEERSFTATINQLMGERWSLRAAYRATWSEFQGFFPEFRAFHGVNIQHRDSELHQLDLAVNWNHESGLFARADALWTHQENDGFRPVTTAGFDEPGDDFWQLNAFIGYRFLRNRGELTVGVLNALDTDYQLEPLSPYIELPHQRAFIVRCRLSF